MKCFTEAELMEKLVEAYRRGVHSLMLGLDVQDEDIAAELQDMIHADTGGHDGWGKKHG